MEKKTKLIIGLGIITTILFLSLFYMIKDLEVIWIISRVLGLLSFLFLFITLLLGESRLLSKNKADFTLFRFHTPIAIFSTYLIFLHFASAIMDNFKWGKSITFIQYLGFDFTDKWLVFLSLGTLAFYLILLIAFTSARKSIQFLGFKKWKLIHYFSYMSFIIAYIHSMNLGTDLRHSLLTPILNPLFIIFFFTITSLIFVRILNGRQVFSDQLEINLASVFFILLILGSLFLVSYKLNIDEKLFSVSSEINQNNNAIDAKSVEIQNLTNEIETIKKTIETVKNG